MGDVIWKSRNRRQLLCPIIVALSVVVIAASGEAVNPLGQASAKSSAQEAEYKDLPVLEPGKPFDFELSSGQTRSFRIDRKSTRLNSSHRCISYAVFCLKKKTYL